MTKPLSKQEASLQHQLKPKLDNQATTITLPRGNLDLSYQTNSHYALDDLLGFAQRINPKRAFLFVSKVLGRHIPVAPSMMRQAFTELADLVPENLPEPIVVVGMAETAVGLSAGVHQALQTRYPQALLLNSTRHAQAEATLLTTFSENHSHASSHLIYQSDDSEIQARLLASKTLVMVDDEASTGDTCVNVVSALREAGLSELQQVHLTTLVDWSLNLNPNSNNDNNPDNHNNNDVGEDNEGSIDKGVLNADDRIATRLTGIQFQRHHLLAGAWQWTDAPNPEPISMPSVDTTEAGSYPVLATGNWGRQPTLNSADGFEDYLARFQHAYCSKYKLTESQEASFSQALPQNILVLGSNEFVWLPFLLAEWLENKSMAKPSSTVEQDASLSSKRTVKFSALTRSPIAIGGAIKNLLSFNDNYGLGMTNFVYNVDPKAWDLIVLCVETSESSVDAMWQDFENVLIVSPE